MKYFGALLALLGLAALFLSLTMDANPQQLQSFHPYHQQILLWLKKFNLPSASLSFYSLLLVTTGILILLRSNLGNPPSS